MIGKKDQEGLPTTEGVNAFLGISTVSEGKISFEGMCRLDGKYDGEILSGDSLVIGETAEVNGQITVNTLTVHGKVNGNITAKKRLVIYPPGKILGDIQTPVLVVSEGAVFEGNCQMERREITGDEKFSSLEVREKGEKERGVKKTEKEPSG